MDSTLDEQMLVATPLAEEYATLVAEAADDSRSDIDWLKLQSKLVQTAEWSPPAAMHLVDLAKNYGAFMLRNALALAVAAGIDDGELGF